MGAESSSALVIIFAQLIVTLFLEKEHIEFSRFTSLCFIFIFQLVLGIGDKRGQQCPWDWDKGLVPKTCLQNG